MPTTVPNTFSERMTRKGISWLLDELSKGHYSNIDHFNTQDVFAVLSRLKVNTDFIALLIGIFWATSNDELKSHVAIAILYHSIGTEFFIFYSTKIPTVLDYLCTVNAEKLEELLIWKHKISWVTSQCHINKVQDVIEFWRKQKFLSVKVVRAVDSQLTTAAND